jgi:hypothetical protein
MSEIPAGICQCGCDKPTTIAKRRRWGNIPGEYLKYIRNHSPNDHAKRKLSKAAGKARGRALVTEYLKTHPCIDCGESDPRCLDFDHRNPVEKLEGIADMICRVQANNVVLATEIAKCDVRCANCHRKRTYDEKHFKNKH